MQMLLFIILDNAKEFIIIETITIHKMFAKVTKMKVANFDNTIKEH